MQKLENQNFIRTCRHELGLTQSAFAKKLHLSLRTVQNWEGGKPVPKYMLYMINRLLWLEMIVKEFISKGEYETMNQMIENQTYRKPDIHEIVKQNIADEKARRSLLTEEERQKEDVENECFALNFDPDGDQEKTEEHRPIYHTTHGWCHGVFRKYDPELHLTAEEIAKRDCEQYCSDVNRGIREKGLALPLCHPEYVIGRGWVVADNES